MSTDFNWQTEEEKWGDEPVVPEQVERPKKRWLPAALVVIIIISAIGFLFYRQVQRQLDEAVARTESDVQRTHELVLQAADRQDRDLLNNMVSSRDNQWLNQQLQLTEEGLLYNPAPFGLVSQNDIAPQYEFDISADLTEAEVLTTRSFTTQSLTGGSETITLKQYAIYRRGEDRWLFSPPKDLAAFWGRTATKEGSYLTVSYPMRDDEQVERLFQFLDSKLAEMCTSLPDFSCPSDYRIFLDLSTDPTSQIDLLDTNTLFENDPDLILPTITLVGLPVDEAGRDALYRGYAVQVIRTAMVNALDWDCCLRGIFFRALIDYQTAELGLRPYPIHPADYERLFSRFQQIDQLDDYWRMRQIELVDADNWQWAYALTEFVLSSPFSETTAGAMQESLVESSLYLNWLSDFFSRSVLEISVQQAWLNFIYNNSLSGQVVEGEFAPQQDILLACEDVTASRTVLYRYIWASNEWITLDQFDEATMFMVSTPDDSAVILQQMNLTSPSSLFLWQDGQTTTLLDSSTPETNGYYSIGLMSPDGRKLTMTRFGEAGYLLLDLEECSDSGCQLYSIPGLPEWSPDGSQMILELLQDSFNAPEINGLARVDRSGMIANIWGRGFAFAPFWLGEEEYGYIQYGEQAGIYAALVADDEPQLLLAEADLLQAIPEAERPDSLIIQEASPNPANHNILAVTAFYEDQDERRSYLFLWNRPVGELIPVGFLSQVVAGLAVWLSNGEWLVVPTYHTRLSGEGASQTYSYQLYHVSGEGRPITVGRGEVLPLDRSIDSEWLAFPNNRYVELIGLKHTLSGNRPYRRLLPHTFTNCRSALFIW